jgi:hypothetical protein
MLFSFTSPEAGGGSIEIVGSSACASEALPACMHGMLSPSAEQLISRTVSSRTWKRPESLWSKMKRARTNGGLGCSGSSSVSGRAHLRGKLTLSYPNNQHYARILLAAASARGGRASTTGSRKCHSMQSKYRSGAKILNHTNYCTSKYLCAE